MNRVRILAVLVLALTAGGALAFGTYNYLQNVPVQTVSAPTRPVVVAAADLSLGSELRSEDLRVVQWPEGAAPEGVFASSGDLLGRGVISPIVRNEPILPAKLAPTEGGSGLPSVIPTGMRAVSVRVNEVIGVAGYVLPGTRVDVLATATPPGSGADPTTKLILPNVQVLTAGTRMEQDQERGRPMQVTVVTLLVNPEQAESLALASTEGKIQLALRNPLDQDEPATPGVRTAALLGGARPAAVPRPQARAAAAPPPPVTIEIIRGDQRVNELVQ